MKRERASLHFKWQKGVPNHLKCFIKKSCYFTHGYQPWIMAGSDRVQGTERLLDQFTDSALHSHRCNPFCAGTGLTEVTVSWNLIVHVTFHNKQLPTGLQCKFESNTEKCRNLWETFVSFQSGYARWHRNVKHTYVWLPHWSLSLGSSDPDERAEPVWKENVAGACKCISRIQKSSKMCWAVSFQIQQSMLSFHQARAELFDINSQTPQRCFKHL